MRGTIRSASFTRLSNYEECEYRARLEYVDRAPKPALVPPPGKQEHPLTRGIRVHEAGDDYNQGKTDQIPPEFSQFTEELQLSRLMVSKGLAITEQLWAYTKLWEPLPIGQFGYWHLKMDLAFNMDPDGLHMGGTDYKTGSSRNKQFTHDAQARLYCIGMIMRYPKAERASCELMYTDEGKVSNPVTLTRRQAVVLAKGWSKRAERMTSAVVFPPKPSVKNCRWCPYGVNVGNEHCDHAVPFSR